MILFQHCLAATKENQKAFRIANLWIKVWNQDLRSKYVVHLTMLRVDKPLKVAKQAKKQNWWCVLQNIVSELFISCCFYWLAMLFSSLQQASDCSFSIHMYCFISGLHSFLVVLCLRFMACLSVSVYTELLLSKCSCTTKYSLWHLCCCLTSCLSIEFILHLVKI